MKQKTKNQLKENLKEVWVVRLYSAIKSWLSYDEKLNLKGEENGKIL